MPYRFFKIGFSLGRCLRDLVNGKVHIDQVVVIVCRTRITNEEQLRACIKAYHRRDGYLVGLEWDKCWPTAKQLWDRCLLFQPRLSGARALVVPEDYVWMNLIPEAHERDPVTSYALNKYLVALKLIEPGEQNEAIIKY
jgi:hypothetical protein